MHEGNLGGGAGGHACGNLFNFSKVSDGECYYNDKTIDFFHIFSDIAIGSENSVTITYYKSNDFA